MKYLKEVIAHALLTVSLTYCIFNLKFAFPRLHGPKQVKAAAKQVTKGSRLGSFSPPG